MKKYAIIIVSLLVCYNLCGQNNFSFSGNLELNSQTFLEDSLIGAESRDPSLTSHLNLIINYKDYLKIGTRLELYTNPIPGFESYENFIIDSNGVSLGDVIANRYIQFQKWNLDVTVGNFYDQFGSGIIFRTYFDPTLGIDNSLDGVRIKYQPLPGIDLTALVGKQRDYWHKKDSKRGSVRGLDAQVYLNDYMFKNSKTNISLGGSFVSKYQKDESIRYVLPENVGAWSSRINVTRGDWGLEAEYAHKINDPSSDNDYIYKNGNSLILSGSYSIKGFGVVLSGKRVDNMSFRSDRDAELTELNINFLTSLNKQQSYSLATIYPYVTNPNGEMGMQFDCFYKIPKKSKLGGKYGTEINLNFSNCFQIDKSNPSDSQQIGEEGTLGYESNFLKIGDEKLFQELNVEIKKKVSKKFKLSTTYINLFNNGEFGASGGLTYEKVHANIFVLETEYKLKPKYTIKTELQHLQTKQDVGNWGMGLIEANLNHWFFSIQDLYNYGNAVSKNHYYAITAGFMKKSHRIEFRYGKVRAGLFCVGGVCREVPASNGFSINLTSSF